METKILDYNVVNKNGHIYTTGDIPKYVPIYSKPLEDLSKEEENDALIVGFAKLSKNSSGVVAKTFLINTNSAFKPFGTGHIDPNTNIVKDYKLLGLFVEGNETL